MIARKPEWLKVKLPSGDNYERLRGIVKDRKEAVAAQLGITFIAQWKRHQVHRAAPANAQHDA